MSRTLTAAVLCCAAGSLAAQSGSSMRAAGGSPDWAAFDRYVAQAARDWRIPGMAIAVVKDDSLVFARGYGVLETGTSRRADEHTRFAIGSTTKAMTSAGLAMLVDEGKLRWDDRVTAYIPELQLYDPWVTRELTVRDLLTHRSGLAGTDLFWGTTWQYSQAEIIRRLRYVPPSASFRSEWQYQNVMYALGGTIIERIAKMPWEAFVRSRIFTPLGMNETEPLVSAIRGKVNVAIPHALIHDSVQVVPIRSTDAVAPAGSVWSSVSDMSKWMRFILDSGRVGPTRLISAATFRELIAPQIRAPINEYPALELAKPDYFSYGLGWFIQDYRGEQMWMHTGSIDGMCAIIGLLPNQRVGVYVLENLDHAELRHALMYSVFDLYKGGPARDWSAELRALFARRVANAVANRASTNPTQAPKGAPSLPLERYAGTYVDSAYGSVRVTAADGGLRAEVVTDAPAPLAPVNFETFKTVPSDRAADPTTLTFVPDGAGGVSGVRIDGVLFARVRQAR